MSECVYSWLLRLYPSAFQESYREEALQLFRDRARDERGFFSGLRLWLDLLSDLAVSIPCSYRSATAAAATAYDGTRLFLTLEDEALNFSSLFYGLMASLTIYTVILFLLSHAGTSLLIHRADLPQSSAPSGGVRGPHSSAAADSSGYPGATAKPGDKNYSAAAGLSTGGAHVPGQAAATVAPADEVAKPLTFEVVSIHEDKSGLGPDNIQGGPTADGYRLRNGPLLTVIQTAYRPSDGNFTFRLKQITGLPVWASFEIRYDIDAKVSEADLPSWKNPALQPAMLRTMLQAMLADRFKLAAHRETRVVPIYELTAGRKRPKLKSYDGATLAEIRQEHPGARMLDGGAIVASGPNPGQQCFFGVTMSQLGTLLSNLAGRPVLDKTGLKGRYDVTYQIELPPPPPAPTDGVPPPPPSPDSDFFRSQISTIVEDQLGLKLKPGTGPVESLVIDHVEQLSEN